ncbi:hypothetical protein [Rheinheimera sp. A13L]|uniref:hypothetical protein n=1 Tax=Rheinheimera sp. A13L TaxID=506534 RepID=UPI00058E0002|nr:hypothetical protein [Rheinheimera sp. A13L]
MPQIRYRSQSFYKSLMLEKINLIKTAKSSVKAEVKTAVLSDWGMREIAEVLLVVSLPVTRVKKKGALKCSGAPD